MLHYCPRCRRVLKYALRDSLCARCLAARTQERPFVDETPTVPNIVPRSLEERRPPPKPVSTPRSSR
jgi:hypothetical protein